MRYLQIKKKFDSEIFKALTVYFVAFVFFALAKQF